MHPEQLKKVEYGTIIYDKIERNADGTPQRWKVNGKVKLWKRNPERIKVPVKRGLYQYGYINESNCLYFSLNEQKALNAGF